MLLVGCRNKYLRALLDTHKAYRLKYGLVFLVNYLHLCLTAQTIFTPTVSVHLSLKQKLDTCCLFELDVHTEGDEQHWV